MENEKEFVHEITDENRQEAKKANQGARLCQIDLVLDDGRKFEGIFREPNNASIARYVSSVSNTGRNKDGISHHSTFALDCAVIPNKDELFTLFKTLPALPISIASELIEGHGLVTDSKKKSL